jgi:hypothetical protein
MRSEGNTAVGPAWKKVQKVKATQQRAGIEESLGAVRFE